MRNGRFFRAAALALALGWLMAQATYANAIPPEP